MRRHRRASSIVLLVGLVCWSPSAIADYRIYYQKVPHGAAPPVERRIESGWVLASLNGSGQCLLSGSACSLDADCFVVSFDLSDKCAVPEGQTANVKITCDGDDDIYLATALVFDGGFETPHVSGNAEVTHCAECAGADADGDGWCAESTGGEPADCNDADASSHPGAAEACDGANNDCSDPLWPLLPVSELDQDADGFTPCEGDRKLSTTLRHRAFAFSEQPR